jgi:phage terminase large subunit
MGQGGVGRPSPGHPPGGATLLGAIFCTPLFFEFSASFFEWGAMEVNLPNNWKPRPDQMPLWNYLQGDGTRAVEVAHRRWGKDDVALHYTATAGFKRVGNYWHMLPQYNQCRKAIWEAVNPRTGKRRIDEAFPKEIRKKTRETDMFIEFVNGSTWQLVGSDNFDALVGSPPIGIVFSEYALSDPMSWAYLSPILDENGGWSVFISTSRGDNHLKRVYDHARVSEEWFGELLTVDDTPVFKPERVLQIRAEYHAQFGPDLGEALFQQEYYCSFQGAVLGAYFSRQMAEARQQGRICEVPPQPGFGVDTSWDLGVDDSMSIWFYQIIGRQIHVIDYYENSGYGLEHYAKILKSKPYVYGNHYMPHDAAAREMTSSEIAMSRKEVAESFGIKPIIIVPRPRNMEKVIHIQIPAARNMIPICWFDEKNTVRGVSALEAFRAEYDEEKKVLKGAYQHDWASHAAMAFITYAVGYGMAAGGIVKPVTTAEKARQFWRAATG